MSSRGQASFDPAEEEDYVRAIDRFSVSPLYLPANNPPNNLSSPIPFGGTPLAGPTPPSYQAFLSRSQFQLSPYQASPSFMLQPSSNNNSPHLPSPSAYNNNAVVPFVGANTNALPSNPNPRYNRGLPALRPAGARPAQVYHAPQSFSPFNSEARSPAQPRLAMSPPPLPVPSPFALSPPPNNTFQDTWRAISRQAYDTPEVQAQALNQYHSRHGTSNFMQYSPLFSLNPQQPLDNRIRGQGQSNPQ